MKGEHATIDLFQGSYTVKLQAKGLRSFKMPLIATQKIQVKDILIVAIGDSYASGEGNPVVPLSILPPADPQWAFSMNAAMNTENADAHRSTIAGPAQLPSSFNSRTRIWR